MVDKSFVVSSTKLIILGIFGVGGVELSELLHGVNIVAEILVKLFIGTATAYSIIKKAKQ